MGLEKSKDFLSGNSDGYRRAVRSQLGLYKILCHQTKVYASRWLARYLSILGRFAIHTVSHWSITDHAFLERCTTSH